MYLASIPEQLRSLPSSLSRWKIGHASPPLRHLGSTSMARIEFKAGFVAVTMISGGLSGKTGRSD